MKNIDIESLLRLKRNEMPSEAFWDSFDAQLSLRLAQEMAPHSRICWTKKCIDWLYQFLPVSATCTVSLLLFFCFFNTTPKMRYVELNNPNSISECRDLALEWNLSTEGLEKNIIQKKMVASSEPTCFSF